MRFTRIAIYTGLILISLTSGTATANDKFLRMNLDLMGGTKFMDVDCASSAPAAALYGCRTGRDGAPHRSVGDFGIVPAVELGFGYSEGAMRFEFLVEYRPRYKFKGRTNFLAANQRQTVSAKLSSISGMLAGFVDLTDGLGNFGSVTPFFGFGVGVAHNRIGKTTMNFPVTTTTVPSGSHTDLAWMATTGISTALNERVTLEFAWRYSNLGEVRTGRGIGSTAYPVGSNTCPEGCVRTYGLSPTRAKLAGHGIRMSLRYSF